MKGEGAVGVDVEAVEALSVEAHGLEEEDVGVDGGAGAHDLRVHLLPEWIQQPARIALS